MQGLIDEYIKQKLCFQFLVQLGTNTFKKLVLTEVQDITGTFFF